ncbi:hypothetical protein ACHAPT_011189 [Fusarium lateritium]
MDQAKGLIKWKWKDGSGQAAPDDCVDFHQGVTEEDAQVLQPRDDHGTGKEADRKVGKDWLSFGTTGRISRRLVLEATYASQNSWAQYTKRSSTRPLEF